MTKKFAPVALAALLCGLPAFSQTTSALTPAMVAALSPAQLATLTSAQLQALSESHVAALTENHLRALSASQINALLLNQVAALTPAQTAGLANARALSLAQIGVLSSAATAGIPASETAAFSSDQVAVLTAAQIEALTPAQMDGVIARMSTAQIQALSAARVDALTPQQMNSAIARLSNAQILGLRPSKLSALTRSQQLALRAELIPLMSLTYLENWMSRNMAPDATFTAEQAAALTPLQVARLPVYNLSAVQIAAWGRAHINSLTPQAASMLFTRFSPTQAAWLTPYQVQSLNPTALTEAQQQVFKQIMAASPTYCPALAEPAVYGTMPAALQAALTNYRIAWERALAQNCFDGGSYKVGANCPADTKMNLINAASSLLNAVKPQPPFAPPLPSFGTMRISDCRQP